MQEIHVEHCRHIAKQYDYPLYLASLLAPRECRVAIWAICALDHELSRIPIVTQEEMIQQIRWAWWRDALEDIYAGKPVRQHEVCEPLANSIKQHALDKSYFDMLLETRFAWLFHDTDLCDATAAKYGIVAALVEEDQAFATQLGRVFALHDQLQQSRQVTEEDHARVQKSLDILEGFQNYPQSQPYQLLLQIAKNHQKRIAKNLKKDKALYPLPIAFRSYVYAAYIALRKK